MRVGRILIGKRMSFSYCVADLMVACCRRTRGHKADAKKETRENEKKNEKRKMKKKREHEHVRTGAPKPMFVPFRAWLRGSLHPF